MHLNAEGVGGATEDSPRDVASVSVGLGLALAGVSHVPFSLLVRVVLDDRTTTRFVMM